MRRVQRTVDDPKFRIFNRNLDTGLDKGRRRGKNQIAPFFYRISDRLLNRFHCNILIISGSNLIWERLLQVKPSQLVSIRPRGRFRSLFIDKCNLLPGGAKRKKPSQNRFLLPPWVHLQINIILGLQKPKLFPALPNQSF